MKCNSEKRSKSEILYGAMLILGVLWTATHTIALPIRVNMDGHHYLLQADVGNLSEFLTGWGDFHYRTPIYPLLLRMSFLLLGHQGIAAILPGVLFGFGGAVLLSDAVKRLSGPLAGAMVLVVTLLNPLLVGYQHFIMTETGSFCFLALFLNILSRYRSLGWLKMAALLGGALGVSYYFRPTFMLMIPVVCFALLVITVVEGISRDISRRRLFLQCILTSVVLVAIPAISMIPWKWLATVSDANRFGPRDPVMAMAPLPTMYAQWLIVQTVFAPSDPLLGDYGEPYAAMIAEARANSARGRISVSGLHITKVSNIAYGFGRAHPDFGLSGFLTVVARNPGRYVLGVGRTLLLYGGAPGHVTVNKQVTNQIFFRTDEGGFLSKFPRGDEIDARHRQRYWYRTDSSFVSTMERNLLWASYRLWPVGVLVTVLGMLICLWRRRLDMFVFSILPIAYALAGAALLMSNDRYIVPAIPFFIANLITIVFSFRRGQRNGGPDVSAPLA